MPLRFRDPRRSQVAPFKVQSIRQYKSRKSSKQAGISGLVLLSRALRADFPATRSLLGWLCARSPLFPKSAAISWGLVVAGDYWVLSFVFKKILCIPCRLNEWNHSGVVFQCRSFSRRCFSLCQSRSFAAARLSWVCLPLAKAISNLARPRFQYIARGITV